MTNVYILPKNAIAQQCNTQGKIAGYFVEHQLEYRSWASFYEKINSGGYVLSTGSIFVPRCLIRHTPFQGET